MLRYFFVLLTILLVNSNFSAQSNISKIGELQYLDILSDVWGYVDSAGNEFALVGVYDGFSIVDISNPAQPVEVFFIPGASTDWRDIKVWKDFAYVTNEGGGGLLIVDLRDLPLVPNYYFWTNGGQLNTSHNIFIDENGVGYLVGHNLGNGGALFLDLDTDPYNPVVIGDYDLRYVHDVFVRGDTMWSAEVNDGIFSVVDVSVKSNPVVMATQGTPGGTSHNLWLSNNGKYLFTTDETPSGFIASYDVSNLANITELDRYQSSPGQNVVPHNTFVLDNFLITSYYRDGVIINDVTQPGNILEVGNFDTSPFMGNGFNGCWGVYPYLPSGYILATDIETGFYVLDANYVQGCYLEGLVSDSISGLNIPNALVELRMTDIKELTSIDGSFATGLTNSGLYDVEVSALGYRSKIIPNVSLTNGNTALVNVELVPADVLNLNITAIDKETSDPVQLPEAYIQNPFFSSENTGNPNGDVQFASIFEGEYDIVVGKWGYVTQIINSKNVDLLNNSVTVELEKGYYDDFALDFGWTVTGNASRGQWERGVPIGTYIGPSPANPDSDIPGDILDIAYVTGNDGGSIGNDDIDDGFTLLSSPVFDLTGYTDPYLQFDRWFINDAGFGDPLNDSLIIMLSNGISNVLIDQVIAGQANVWTHITLKISDWIAPSPFMQLTVFANDSDPGHVVEAGFDGFLVTDGLPLGADEPENFSYSLFPVPSSGILNLRKTVDQAIESLHILSMDGRVIKSISNIDNSSPVVPIDIEGLSSGIYLLSVISSERQLTMKFVVSE